MYTKEYRKQKLRGWGNYPRAVGNVFRPERVADLYELLNRETGPFLARGGGTSYGDAAINIDGINIDTRRLNKMLHFDQESGILHCQSGVTLKDIIKTFLPRGWFLNITPGTQFCTVGGCTACDSHGKNWKDGSFGSYVKGFNLMLHDGRILYCDEEHNAGMYFATLGGMGMTGITLDVKLQLKKISSSYVDVETVRFNNLRELFDLIKDSWNSYSYIFSWVDSHKEGDNMARGALQRANHVDNGTLYYAEKKRVSIPFNFPGFVINKYTVEAFNALIYAKAGFGKNKRRLLLMDYFYPLDNLAHWYRIYGKNGFLEYQVAIPKESAYEAISDILKIVTKSRLGSIVAAIKPIIKSKGLLSFPIDGFTLAVDFQYNQNIFQLLDELDEIVIANGGRVYLSKDSRLHAEKFNRMYSETLSDWEKVRTDYQINKKFNSLMFNRLLKLK